MCFVRFRLHCRLLLILGLWCTVWTSTLGGGFDPYTVLGVSRGTPQKEVQKCYRKLCLQYHPDKNVNKSTKERERCEKKFKQVQEAYDMIQNPSPRYVPGQGGQQPYSRRYANTYASAGGAEQFFRAFEGNDNFFFYRTGTNGPVFGMRTPFMSHASPSLDSFKSIYIQKVKVPLQDLYKGKESFRLELNDNIFTRFKAAIRGKSIYWSLMLSCYVSLPIIRISRTLAAVIGISVVHTTLPQPDPLASYVTSLRRGARGGQTNIKFKSAGINHQPGIEIIFEIEEERHPVYRRENNDLHSEITITSKQAKTGCKIKLDPLDPNEKPIEIAIPPKTYSYRKQQGKQKRKKSDTSSSDNLYENTIRIRGRGWPIRNTQHNENHPDVYLNGDLYVTVNVSKQSSKGRNKR
mmetsp:Transcript_15094/g.34799  ORF Transcript_15094/g.34799 Transcript_15094/m.34799 type:complete len:407 (+) Transcript_15094:167-1387(+)